MAFHLMPGVRAGVLHDADGNPITSTLDGVKRRLDVSASVTVVPAPPGTAITTPADVVVGVGATVALGAIPVGTLRMTVQVTAGDSTTRLRIREAGGVAGAGIILNLLGSRVYGGSGQSALDTLEAENVAGPAAAVASQFEG